VVANLLEQGAGIVGGAVLVAGLLLFVAGLLAPVSDGGRAPPDIQKDSAVRQDSGWAGV
jgi:hypothetical protein